VSAPETWAVVPAKRLAGALRRLAPALGRSVRRELQVAMLADVFAACAGARGLAGLLVVTSDPDVAALGRARAGARVIADHDPPRGMNGAVARGLAWATAQGAAAALVLTADLPLACPEDVVAILDAGPAAPSAVLVPSHEGTGTNAMLLAPPMALAPRLGPRSLERHLAQASRRGVASVRRELPRLALDIDTPRDLAALIAGGGECATLEACARLSVAELLAAGSAL
jgi:2-phospho-L-lactate/phosphoenolpyruvate guanylyltransferase